MKRIIHKNRRRSFPFFNLFPLRIISKKKSFVIEKWIKFTDSSIYSFDDEDQDDVNKLFGFSIGYHHKNSFRFGWRPNNDLTKMEILSYEYQDGIRKPITSICDVQLNKWYKYVMIYFSIIQEVKYCIYDENGNMICTEENSSVKLKNNLNLGYDLGLYFGGNKKAPHNITIYMERA